MYVTQVHMDHLQFAINHKRLDLSVLKSESFLTTLLPLLGTNPPISLGPHYPHDFTVFSTLRQLLT